MRIEISDADHRRLRILAVTLGVSVHALIGRAVVEMLDREETRGA